MNDLHFATDIEYDDAPKANRSTLTHIAVSTHPPNLNFS